MYSFTLSTVYIYFFFFENTVGDHKYSTFPKVQTGSKYSAYTQDQNSILGSRTVIGHFGLSIGRHSEGDIMTIK